MQSVESAEGLSSNRRWMRSNRYVRTEWNVI